MRKLNYLILISIFTALLFSCTKDTDELNDVHLQEQNEISRQITEAKDGLTNSQIDSFAFTIPEVDARGGKVEFINETVYMTSGSWYGYQFSKETLKDYKIYLEISTSGGSAKVYVYTYDGGYEYVRSGYTASVVGYDDLGNSDTAAYIGVYAATASSVTFTYLYERVEVEEDEVEIHFNDSSPSSGHVGSTNFSFNVNVEGSSSSAYGKIVFYAPSNYYYNFDLSKNGSNLYHSRTLSQSGTYYYRYEVTVNGETTISGWKNITVYGNSSGGGSDDYDESCLETRYSNCEYAKDENAFYVTSYGQYLQGQCTWYAYGRVIELVDEGHFDNDIAEAFEDAFWGTTNRHARNWPSKLGRSWENTNYNVLPSSKRKAGMLAVWIFGEYGHVGFVEEISADGSKYRLSDFNRGGNTTKRDQWYSFTGTEDKLGGVYPRFLDLNQF